MSEKPGSLRCNYNLSLKFLEEASRREKGFKKSSRRPRDTVLSTPIPDDAEELIDRGEEISG